MKQHKDLLVAWLPLAVAATCVIGAAYLLVFQDMRLSANDPQIQMAEDAAALLMKDRPVGQVVHAPDRDVDLSNSLMPFLAVYDEDGKPLGWSMTLDGHPPTPPAGVFAYAKAHGIDTVSWQPRPNLRQALVVVPYAVRGGSTGYVASGRSLRTIERRASQARTLAIIAWCVAMAMILLACLVVRNRKHE